MAEIPSKISFGFIINRQNCFKILPFNILCITHTGKHILRHTIPTCGICQKSPNRNPLKKCSKLDEMSSARRHNWLERHRINIPSLRRSSSQNVNRRWELTTKTPVVHYSFPRLFANTFYTYTPFFIIKLSWSCINDLSTLLFHETIVDTNKCYLVVKLGFYLPLCCCILSSSYRLCDF